MERKTIFENISNFAEIKINEIHTSRKEFWMVFILLVAFNGLHMWLYQIFQDNGMLETHLRLVIIIKIIYVIMTAILITFLIAIFRKNLLKGPMDQLCTAAKKIARGDFSIRIYTKNKNKNYIDNLFDDFNTMTEELARINEKLKSLSITDELTKLNNRRSFLEYMDMVWKQGQRLNQPISVMLLDIDYFKKYNDSLGHLEGDKALIAVAQSLKNQVKRETDFVARFGGEEFVCLLPFINKDEAIEFAKSMVKSIEDLNITHPKSEISKYVTVSVGISTGVPDKNNSMTQLLDNADKALYTAKESGRNRAVMY